MELRTVSRAEVAVILVVVVVGEELVCKVHADRLACIGFPPGCGSRDKTLSGPFKGDSDTGNSPLFAAACIPRKHLKPHWIITRPSIRANNARHHFTACHYLFDEHQLGRSTEN